MGLTELGLSEDRLAQFNRLAASPNGIILVTGPTGSGKTTTLYATLSSINTPDINIITIEDPVEYQIRGISQIQVNRKIELTFARGLRSIVRQDPDVILVGEIRDLETAEIAVQSALTGPSGLFHPSHPTIRPAPSPGWWISASNPFLISSSVHRRCRPAPDPRALSGLQEAVYPGRRLRDGLPSCRRDSRPHALRIRRVRQLYSDRVQGPGWPSSNSWRCPALFAA